MALTLPDAWPPRCKHNENHIFSQFTAAAGRTGELITFIVKQPVYAPSRMSGNGTNHRRSAGRNLRRFVWIGFGWFFFGLGLLGVFLPVLPTTPFMILALWAFSNGSRRLRDWLYNHPAFGRSLRLWERYRVIPARAKIAALAAMSLSLGWMLLFSSLGWPWIAATAALMAYGAWYVLTKPGRPPRGGTAGSD